MTTCLTGHAVMPCPPSMFLAQVTYFGQIVGLVTQLLGVITLALPLSIIGRHLTSPPLPLIFILPCLSLTFFITLPGSNFHEVRQKVREMKEEAELAARRKEMEVEKRATVLFCHLRLLTLDWSRGVGYGRLNQWLYSFRQNSKDSDDYSFVGRIGRSRYPRVSGVSGVEVPCGISRGHRGGDWSCYNYSHLGEVRCGRYRTKPQSTRLSLPQ